MKYRTYQNSDLSISLLGLGCMRLPKIDPNKSDIDEAAAQEMVDYAYEHGINYFDTAHMYHDGASEEFMGRALKKFDRKSYFLATKMPVWMAESKEDIAKIFDLQLKRLQTDYFDFYLVHSLNVGHYQQMKEFGVYEFLKQKKEEGVIRHLGFSFHDKPELLEQICEEYEWDFAQIQLNYLDWEMQNAKRQYEILQAHHLPCIVMEPVRGGTLANPCEKSNQIFKAANPERSVASWALRYAATLPNVMTVLSGMSNMEQLQDNLSTMDPFVPLEQKDYEVIEQAVAAYKDFYTIPCTGCRYCMECPAGVEIPKMFALYNQYAPQHDTDGYKKAYLQTPESERVNHCVACGKCAKHCPQLIDIPERMKYLANYIKEHF